MLAGTPGARIEQVRKDIERDKILTADEAVEYGLVDEVIRSRARRLRYVRRVKPPMSSRIGRCPSGGFDGDMPGWAQTGSISGDACRSAQR